jgi:hypothetical protein
MYSLSLYSDNEKGFMILFLECMKWGNNDKIMFFLFIRQRDSSVGIRFGMSSATLWSFCAASNSVAYKNFALRKMYVQICFLFLELLNPEDEGIMIFRNHFNKRIIGTLSQYVRCEVNLSPARNRTIVPRCPSIGLATVHSSPQLYTRFAYLIRTVLSAVYSVFCIVLWHCTDLCFCFSSVCCTVHCSCIVLCLLVMYALLP